MKLEIIQILKEDYMISWKTEDEKFYTVTSEASDLVLLERELIETITKFIKLNLFKSESIEFYSDATNGSFFINELNENQERVEESKTVHFCALKLWEDYDDSNEFDFDMKSTLQNSIENLKSEKKISIPFKIVLRDELGDEEVIY
ncbi:MAG: hypothetical protein J0L67_14490 [Cytophagales bacterium]|nr:hypothetical protein [Cytophagales bacterium]